MNEKIDENKCYKIKLKSILNKNDDREMFLNQINEIVINFNKLISDTYDFIKLYYLSQYELGNILPIIDKNFILSIMKILGVFNRKRKCKMNESEIDKSLNNFYLNCFSVKLKHTKINISKADNFLQYTSGTILTMITNNIKQRFVKHLNRFINITLKDLKLDNCILNEFKHRLLFNKRDKINPLFNNWMELYFNDVLPINIDTNVHYDVAKDPLKYIPCMIFMNKTLAIMDMKIFNVFPSKNTSIPGHIFLDTKTLVGLLNIDLLTENNKILTNSVCYNNYLGISNLLWSKVFDMKKSIFKNKIKGNVTYIFNYMIQTDGYSCSLIFGRSDCKKTGTIKSDKKSKIVAILATTDW